MFLQQQGNDPFTEVPERIAQANAVANRIARFITLAQATLDIAIYDFRLHGEPAAIIVEAIRECTKAGVAIRIAFDAATNPGPPVSPRSEEHTSELQSLRHLVCRLLLEKKKKKDNK